MRKKNPPVPPRPMPCDLNVAKDFLYKNTTNFAIGNKTLQNRETLVFFFRFFGFEAPISRQIKMGFSTTKQGRKRK
jgi:hypothetical protein